jgi:hypothetical protein
MITPSTFSLSNNETKLFTEQTLIEKPKSTVSVENGVSSDTPTDSYVQSVSDVTNYDIERYTKILKNMVIPPQDRADISILLELELNNNMSASELRNLIDEIDRKEFDKETSKVKNKNADDDSMKEETPLPVEVDGEIKARTP